MDYASLGEGAIGLSGLLRSHLGLDGVPFDEVPQRIAHAAVNVPAKKMGDAQQLSLLPYAMHDRRAENDRRQSATDQVLQQRNGLVQQIIVAGADAAANGSAALDNGLIQLPLILSEQGVRIGRAGHGERRGCRRHGLSRGAARHARPKEQP